MPKRRFNEPFPLPLAPNYGLRPQNFSFKKFFDTVFILLLCLYWSPYSIRYLCELGNVNFEKLENDSLCNLVENKLYHVHFTVNS